MKQILPLDPHIVSARDRKRNRKKYDKPTETSSQTKTRNDNMSTRDDFKQSRFMTKSDVGEKGKLLTIKSVNKENVAAKEQPASLKHCIHFVEAEKPLVCNLINYDLIAKISGKTNTDEWTGVKVVVYEDPTIAFGGKVTGGLRCRAPKSPEKKADGTVGPDNIW